MPRRLLERARPDSIREFRAAAQVRFDDGLALAAAERRAGAIYLWGYSAEMTLKAAYFTHLGVGEAVALDYKTDIAEAIKRGKQAHKIDWPPAGQGHNVRAWADLLVMDRAASGAAHPPQFEREIQRRGQRVGLLWRETLRYHANTAYAYEVRQVREAAEWFLSHSLEL